MADHPKDITLRDYFAAKAIQAIIGMYVEQTQKEPERRPGGTVQETVGFPSDDFNEGIYDVSIAANAYRIADAMIEAQKTTNPKRRAGRRK